jgi:hypothetical protein
MLKFTTFDYIQILCLLCLQMLKVALNTIKQTNKQTKFVHIQFLAQYFNVLQHHRTCYSHDDITEKWLILR